MAGLHRLRPSLPHSPMAMRTLCRNICQTSASTQREEPHTLAPCALHIYTSRWIDHTCALIDSHTFAQWKHATITELLSNYPMFPRVIGLYLKIMVCDSKYHTSRAINECEECIAKSKFHIVQRFLHDGSKQDNVHPIRHDGNRRGHAPIFQLPHCITSDTRWTTTTRFRRANEVITVDTSSQVVTELLCLDVFEAIAAHLTIEDRRSFVCTCHSIHALDRQSWEQQNGIASEGAYHHHGDDRGSSSRGDEFALTHSLLNLTWHDLVYLASKSPCIRIGSEQVQTMLHLSTITFEVLASFARSLESIRTYSLLAIGYIRLLRMFDTYMKQTANAKHRRVILYVGKISINHAMKQRSSAASSTMSLSIILSANGREALLKVAIAHHLFQYSARQQKQSRNRGDASSAIGASSGYTPAFHEAGYVKRLWRSKTARRAEEELTNDLGVNLQRTQFWRLLYGARIAGLALQALPWNWLRQGLVDARLEYGLW